MDGKALLSPSAEAEQSEQAGAAGKGSKKRTADENASIAQTKVAKVAWDPLGTLMGDEGGGSDSSSEEEGDAAA